ncbi:ABC transporter ATP-binding protein [Polaromonas sp. YR568]|uniref:ABC transporter ATP-binding protein n=1 Tax=Polaromonas sp. YR568 TaxID=1855301 RepID=UPI003137FB10
MTKPAQSIIEVDNLSMSYPLAHTRVDVLRGVNLRIAAGTRVAIAGPSGSGKTSLLLLFSGLERPSSGRVVIDGVDLGQLDRDGLADLRRERVGIVFQSFHLLPSLSALDNVALPLQMTGQRDARDQARSMLARVGLSGRLDHFPTQLSGGEQQRVAIARALVHRPRLLLADEPTGNLDDTTAESVRELLFELNRDMGTTLILVTHDLDFAARCDRVLRLHDGQLIETLPHAVHSPLPNHQPSAEGSTGAERHALPA